MGKKQQGFVVGVETRTVKLLARQNGAEHPLTHVLRQPTMKEMTEYERRSIVVSGKGRKTKCTTNVTEARAWLYDTLIQDVEGYVDERTKKSLSAQTADWKEQIPVMHKSAVIESFGEVDEETQEDDEKN